MGLSKHIKDTELPDAVYSCKNCGCLTFIDMNETVRRLLVAQEEDNVCCEDPLCVFIRVGDFEREAREFHKGIMGVKKL